MSEQSAQRFRGCVRTLACTLAGLIAAAGVAATGQPMVVVATDEARLVPLDPARPDGPRVAVLWGDPHSGPSTMLLELQMGAVPLHRHTADYHLVLLEGTMKHWAAGEDELAARPLGPGSYWFQPGGAAHGDACLSDRCLMFVSWAGRRDGSLAEPNAPE